MHHVFTIALAILFHALTRERNDIQEKTNENCNHLHRWCVLGQSGTRAAGCDKKYGKKSELWGFRLDLSTTNNRMEQGSV